MVLALTMLIVLLKPRNDLTTTIEGRERFLSMPDMPKNIETVLNP
jgi:hypothetical protein